MAQFSPLDVTSLPLSTRGAPDPWRDLLLGLPNAIGVFGQGGEPLFLNDAARALLGLQPRFLRPDGEPASLGARAEEEVRLDGPGEARYLRVNAKTVSFGGRPAVLASFFEVTKRWRAERDVARAERRLAQVLHASPAAVCIATLQEGRILHVNDKFLELVGRPREQLVGRTTVEAGLWASAAERSRVLKAVEARGSARNVEIQFRRKTGEVRQALTSFEVAQGDDEKLLIGLCSDVTDRREMKRSLAEYARRYQLFIETVEDYAIFLLDAEGRVVTWNVGAERLYRQTEEEVIGKPLAAFATREDARRGKLRRALKEAAAKGRFSYRRWIVRKDGTRFYAEMLLTSLRDEKGEVTGYAKITRDLTEHRKAQQAEDLKRRDQIQREIVATVSHELRTPIAAIRGFAETLLKGAMSDAKNRRRFVEIIDSHAERLSRLVEDILSLSALDARTEGRPVNLALRPFIEKAASGLEPLMRPKKLAISIDTPPGLRVRADADRLGQVLHNLLSNAIKYNSANGRIEVRAARRGSRVYVSVADTGVGIPKNQLPLIFQRFHRTEEGRRTASGSGLGLSIVKKIVESWRGRVWAESEGRGTVFHFTVPAA